MARFDPARPDFFPYGYSCVSWTPTAMPRSDRHNEIEINLLERGRLVYLLGGRKVVVPTGKLTLFWAVVPHQILEFDSVSDYYVATIPLSWFLQWRLPDDFNRAILHGEIVIDPSDDALSSDLIRFATWSEDAKTGVEERLQVSLLEIEARLRRLALSVSMKSRRRNSLSKADEGQLSRAEQMAGFIALHYTQPLTTEMISQHVGLHPNYAMALFQQTFGTTLIKYVNQHRLSHAQRLLLTTKDLVLEIAYNSGFGSLSRFNEAFRQTFHCTPRQYRKMNPSTQTSTY